jgi:hypothetical protein
LQRLVVVLVVERASRVVERRHGRARGEARRGEARRGVSSVNARAGRKNDAFVFE